MRETNTQIRPETERNTEYSAPEVVETNGGTSNSWLYVWMVWEQRSFIFRCAMFGAVASLILAFLLPKEYEATTQLMPPDGDGLSAMSMMASKVSALAENPMIGKFASEALGGKTPGALFVGVLQSRTVQDRIIDKFDLRREYWVSHYDSARKKLTNKTAISEDRKSGIITISVTDRSPRRAADLANAYVNQLNSLVAELSTSSAHRERVFLEERLKVVKRDLDDASNQFAKFSSENNTLDIQQEGKAMLDAAGNIAGQMVAAQSQLEGLRQIYTDNNSRVRSLNAHVAELRKQLEKLGGTQGNGAEPSRGQTADHSVGKNADMPYPTIRSLPLLGVKYGEFYRGAKIQETVYELLTQQYELAKVQEAKETPSVKILDPASIPEKKSFPPRLMIMLLGTLFAVSVCVVWVLGAEQWRAADPDDPRKILANEVVATLKARAHWFSRNGTGSSAEKDKNLDRFDSLEPQSGESERQ